MTVGEMKALLSDYDDDDDIECNIYIYDHYVEGRLAIRGRDGTLILCHTFRNGEEIYPFGHDILSSTTAYIRDNEERGNNERKDTSMEEFMECIE